MVTVGRKNGKNFKPAKTAFRTSNIGVNKKLSAFELRKQKAEQEKALKQKLKEMEDEKKAERKARLDAIKARKEAKEEKERLELLHAKMHAKKVERLRKKEKRNKLLKER